MSPPLMPMSLRSWPAFSPGNSVQSKPWHLQGGCSAPQPTSLDPSQAELFRARPSSLVSQGFHGYFWGSGEQVIPPAILLLKIASLILVCEG